MFLDEKLIEICKNTDVDTPEKIQELNRVICRECELYYKSKINLQMGRLEVKAILDRTFNLYDSFVKMALKSNDYKLQILGEMFQKYTFKSQLLENKEMARIYALL